MSATEGTHTGFHVAPEDLPNIGHLLQITVRIFFKKTKLDYLMYTNIHNSRHKKNISPYRDLILITSTTTHIIYGYSLMWNEATCQGPK